MSSFSLTIVTKNIDFPPSHSNRLVYLSIYPYRDDLADVRFSSNHSSYRLGRLLLAIFLWFISNDCSMSFEYPLWKTFLTISVFGVLLRGKLGKTLFSQSEQSVIFLTKYLRILDPQNQSMDNSFSVQDVDRRIWK